MNESMTPKPEGCQVPLTELLRNVPIDAREWIEESPYSGRNIPYGRMCHEAADAIFAALARAEKAEAELERVRQDAQRYRWLSEPQHYALIAELWMQWLVKGPDSLGKAIDAAIEQEKKDA